MPKITGKQVALGVTAVFVVGLVIWRFFGRSSPSSSLSELGRGIDTSSTSRPPSTGLYNDLINDREPSPTNIDVWSSSSPTPGGAIMNGYAFGGLTRGNVTTLSNRLYGQANGHWTWEGGGAGDSPSAGAKFLDGNLQAGECGYLANALSVLLTSDNPYGAEQDNGLFQVVTYSGKYPTRGVGSKNGFISAHANTPLNLEPNVYTTLGVQVPFYWWGNHKVMSYDGRYFDPTYGTSQGGPGYYPDLESMAAAQIFSPVVPGDTQFGDIAVHSLFMTDDAAPRALRGVYIVCFENTSNQQLSTDARASTNRSIAIGPICESGGNASNSFNFDTSTNYLAGIDRLT